MTVDELVNYADEIEGEGNARINRDADPLMCTMSRGELRAIAEKLVQLPQGARVIEIGVYCGRTASIMLNLQSQLDLDITLIDNWSWNAPDSKIAFWHFIEQRFPYTPFTMREMTSHEARELWDQRDDKTVDFIHIDGCHDYFWIEKDCAMWMPLVRVGGIAMFHDYSGHPATAGVPQAVDEHCSSANGWVRLGEVERLAIRMKTEQVGEVNVWPHLQGLWDVYGRPVLETMGIAKP